MKTKSKKLLGAGLGLLGMGIVWYATSWIAALGLWIALTGTNIENSTRVKDWLND